MAVNPEAFKRVCVMCTKRAINAKHCAIHLELHRDIMRDLYRRYNRPVKQQYCNICGHPDHNARRHYIGVLA